MAIKIKSNVLSKREEEVLKELAIYGDYDVVAEKLFISKKTLLTHVAYLFKKKKVHNLAQLIIKYYTEHTCKK